MWNSITTSAFISTILLAIQPHSLAAAEEVPPWHNSRLYTEGELGRYPTQDYRSARLVAPQINEVSRSDECARGLHTFLTPRGLAGKAREPQATILDAAGNLAWTTGWGGKQIYNLMVQELRGEQVLTFWAGDDTVEGHGAGSYYILDSSYRLIETFNAANGMDGDLHEFKISEQGTALLTVYQVKDNYNLTALGREEPGPIWDCYIQEIDMETDEVIFQWSAADHIDVNDTFRGIGDSGVPGGEPFDFFHINSIDKDPWGNYLISSRYTHSIYCVEGRTGSVLWVLGGKRNMFDDLSGGNATNFRFQHHARWADNYEAITLFDNSADSGEESTPRGVRLGIRVANKTVELLNEYRSPTVIPAPSQGSMQDLPGGNVLLGYGYSGAMAEFSRGGRVLCQTHYGPASGFGSGDVQSYRVFKFPWSGYPADGPSLRVARDAAGVWRAFASWNGATEVRRWVLQGAEGPDDAGNEWSVLGGVVKVGFEAGFALRAGHPAFLRVQALGEGMNALGVSKVVNASRIRITYILDDPDAEPVRHHGTAWLGMLASWVVGFLCCGALHVGLQAMGVGVPPFLYRRLSEEDLGATPIPAGEGFHLAGQGEGVRACKQPRIAMSPDGREKWS